VCAIAADTARLLLLLLNIVVDKRPAAAAGCARGSNKTTTTTSAVATACGMLAIMAAQVLQKCTQVTYKTICAGFAVKYG
jgi:hypothetical protein